MALVGWKIIVADVCFRLGALCYFLNSEASGLTDIPEHGQV